MICRIRGREKFIRREDIILLFRSMVAVAGTTKEEGVEIVSAQVDQITIIIIIINGAVAEGTTIMVAMAIGVDGSFCLQKHVLFYIYMHTCMLSLSIYTFFIAGWLVGLARIFMVFHSGSFWVEFVLCFGCCRFSYMNFGAAVVGSINFVEYKRQSLDNYYVYNVI